MVSSSNVLFFGNRLVKISAFGLQCEVGSSSESSFITSSSCSISSSASVTDSTAFSCTEATSVVITEDILILIFVAVGVLTDEVVDCEALLFSAVAVVTLFCTRAAKQLEPYVQTF